MASNPNSDVELQHLPKSSSQHPIVDSVSDGDSDAKHGVNHEAKSVAETASDGSKEVLFVRHARSEYNDWKFSLTTWLTCACCGDPMIVDPRLCAEGEKQASLLASSFQQSKLHEGVELIVTSPFTRAIQTALALSQAFPSSSRPPLLACALHSEILDTSGDTGRLLVTLREEFPSVDFSACQDHWWYYDVKKGYVLSHFLLGIANSVSFFMIYIV